MPTSRFFWKLVLICSGLNFAAAVVIGFVLSIALHDQLLDLVAARRWIWGLVGVESLAVFGFTYWAVGILIRPIAC